MKWLFKKKFKIEELERQNKWLKQENDELRNGLINISCNLESKIASRIASDTLMSVAFGKINRS